MPLFLLFVCVCVSMYVCMYVCVRLFWFFFWIIEQKETSTIITLTTKRKQEIYIQLVYFRKEEKKQQHDFCEKIEYRELCWKVGGEKRKIEGGSGMLENNWIKWFINCKLVTCNELKCIFINISSILKEKRNWLLSLVK